MLEAVDRVFSGKMHPEMRRQLRHVLKRPRPDYLERSVKQRIEKQPAKEMLEEIKDVCIDHMLNRCRGNQSEACRRLGFSRNFLLTRLKARSEK